jgi:hypothetical protein
MLAAGPSKSNKKSKSWRAGTTPAHWGGAGVGLFFIKFPLRLDPLQKNRKQNFGFL